MKLAPARIKQHLAVWRSPKKVLTVVGVFAVLGTAIVLLSLAATNSVELEAESASASGNTGAVDDAAASGGKALHFGQQTNANLTPTRVRAFSGGDSIAIRWKAVDAGLNPVKYHVFRDGAEVSVITIASAPVHMYESPGTLYVDTNVTDAQSYKYHIQTETQTGSLSAKSAEVAVTYSSGGIAIPTITHVTNGVTGMDSYFAIADETIRTWYPKIANLLTKGGQFSVPGTIVVNIVPGSACGVADTESDSVTAKLNICEQYARDHPEDIAMIIHEFTHGIQNFNAEPTTKMLQEGSASWASDQAMGHEQEPPGITDTFDDGYSPASYFFSWIEQTYNKPDLVPDMFVARHAQSIDGVTLIQQQTGKDVGQLWTEMTGRTVSSLGRLKNGGDMCAYMYYDQTDGAKLSACHPTIFEAVVYLHDPANAEQGLLKYSTHSQCLSVAGAVVGLGDCDFNNNTALWRVAGGTIKLASTGACLDTEGGSMADSAKLRMSDCSGSASQSWSLDTDW